ncbi:MAG: S41 family peptidase [Synechococcales cyanobacterium]
MRHFGIPVLITLIGGSLSLGPSVAQDLPPIPQIPTFNPPTATPDPAADPTLPTPTSATPEATVPASNPTPTAAPNALTTPSAVPVGTDLRQLVQLFINESLRAGQNPEAVNYNALYEKLLAQRIGDPRPAQEVEYAYLQALLEQYGEKGDRLLTPAEFNTLLNRPRPPLGAEEPSPGVQLIKIPEMTPNTPLELRELLRRSQANRGVILDLRGATGYDPQVVAATARLFLPTTVKPLVISEDRFQQQTPWDDAEIPLAAGRPLVVLVDGQTQQGAVLLAAQLATSGATQILGQPTQGTEFQRKFYVLPSGAAVELTIGRWLTGDGQAITAGLVPLRTLPNDPNPGAWIAAAVDQLRDPQSTALTARPTVLINEGRVGRFALGLDLRELEGGALGTMDFIPATSGHNIFQPNSDLRIFYVQDYVLFGYRPPSILRSFFANRIYSLAADARTAEGIGVGATYEEVVQAYGQFGENGFNDIKPFPMGSREFGRADRYFINYDALGLSFIFQAGSNRVIGIGLYKPGN